MRKKCRTGGKGGKRGSWHDGELGEGSGQGGRMRGKGEMLEYVAEKSCRWMKRDGVVKGRVRYRRGKGEEKEKAGEWNECVGDT